MLKYLKDENFQEEIKSGLVLVDFYADWCGPCRMISPVVEEYRHIANAKNMDSEVVNTNEEEMAK